MPFVTEADPPAAGGDCLVSKTVYDPLPGFLLGAVVDTVNDEGQIDLTQTDEAGRTVETIQDYVTRRAHRRRRERRHHRVSI